MYSCIIVFSIRKSIGKAVDNRSNVKADSWQRQLL